MLSTSVKNMIAAHVLNCAVEAAASLSPNQQQENEIESLEKAVETCIDRIFFELSQGSSEGTALKQADYDLFNQMHAYTAARILDEELKQRGFILDQSSFSLSRELAAEGESGFILKGKFSIMPP